MKKNNTSAMEIIDESMLAPVLATEFTKEDYERMLAEKDAVIQNYSVLVEETKKESQNIMKSYNTDMQYVTTINANLIKNFRTKEDAFLQITSALNTLMTLDRAEIAPERKENE